MPDIFAYVVDTDNPTPTSHQEKITVGSGAQGAQGSTGAQGFQGDNGGAQGSQGSQGGIGSQGAQGFQGTSGGGGGSVAMSSFSGDGSTAINTASTSITDMTTVTLAVPAANGDHLFIALNGVVFSSSGSPAVWLSFDVSGTALQEMAHGLTTNSSLVSLIMPHTVSSGEISGGNVTVKVRWRVSSSTANMTNSADGKPELTVLNLG